MKSQQVLWKALKKITVYGVDHVGNIGTNEAEICTIKYDTDFESPKISVTPEKPEEGNYFYTYEGETKTYYFSETKAGGNKKITVEVTDKKINQNNTYIEITAPDGTKTRVEPTEEEIKNIRKDILNITLIGMPGSGKSVIGRRLAKFLGQDFADTDEEVVKRTGKTPEELIISGETEKFREVEEEILKDFGKEQNRIISTGGGAVEREANGFYIKQNSFVVYIKRDINRLDLRGRPLSPDTDSAKKLFGKRKKLYEKDADYTADNNNDTETTVREIIKAYEIFSAERT